ncbi:MAG: hypothetical protein A4E28_02562 [Methanocella sp. PtaU1.Bin125]|nr:MAG: hypothetical protein A4E28_02562 [Methanocella sp. PtaU1.Bin125]
MDRRLLAVGMLALIVAIVTISGCTSGPATNATLTPTPAPIVNKTMTNVSDTGMAGNNTGLTGNNTTLTGVNPVATMVNNTTKAPAAGSPTIPPK